MLPVMTSADCDSFLKPVLLKDLRIQCRVRGLNPAGGQEALRERVKEHMFATGDFTLKTETGAAIVPEQVKAVEAERASNNYARPNGQNVGNYLTDRNTSRVLAPQEDTLRPQMPLSPALVNPPAPAAPAPVAAAHMGAPQAPWDAHAHDKQNNNYSRPQGQNVGNFLTDRNSSRVLAPPGGASQISFG